PVLPTVDAPMAVGPKPADERPTANAPDAGGSPIGPLDVALVAILIVLAAVHYRDRRRARLAAGLPADASAAGSTTERYFPLVLLMFVGSGCAALMYEIIWFQKLQLVLGSSAVSIAVLLGTFMGGMCIGSLALARYVKRDRHPL